MLKMYGEAIEELATLPAEVLGEAVVVEMHLVTFMQAKEWERALEYGRTLCKLRPEEISGFIHSAFCLHELGRTAEAKELLTSGPPALLKEANYFYNLACYECVLDHLDEAQKHLTKSFELDSKYRDFAKNDPDLQALRALGKKK